MKISRKMDRNLPLKFDQQEWEGYSFASCYLYAINLHINSNLLVGQLIGKRCNVDTPDDVLIKVLREEIEAIGYSIERIENDTIIDEGEFKICLIKDYRTGWYHFLRQDGDGNWSHKYPLELPRTVEYDGDCEFRKSWYFKIGIGKC